MKITIKGIVKENKEDLIVNKISQYMLEDTQYEYNQRGERMVILFPFYNVENYYSLENVLRILIKRKENINTRSPEILTYILYTYGVEDWDLIVKITKRYFRIN
jgi:hypothetical protein